MQGATTEAHSVFLFFVNCKPLWLEGTALCAAHAHPDLGRVHNTLGQLGTNEGHFVAVFYLMHRGAVPGLQGWPTEPKTESCTMRRHNNTGAVYGARKQKHTAEAGDAHGEGNGLRRRRRRVCAASGHRDVTKQAAAFASARRSWLSARAPKTVSSIGLLEMLFYLIVF